MKKIILSFLLFLSIHSFSQKISGIVLDGNTKKPIIGASVYFDNTTIGVSTNNKGEFVLRYKSKIKTPLIVSFIGYISLRKTDLSINKKMKIYLYKSNSVLDEVVINTNDGWSKELKMKEFLKHFLGDTENGRACKIVNKEDIILRYNKAKKQLTAKGIGPILIKNPNLGFLISVELSHFEVNYSSVGKNTRNFDHVYYSSTNFYKSTHLEVSQETSKKRNEAYEGSVLHFMRALSKKQLFKNGYKAYNEDETFSVYNAYNRVNYTKDIEIQKLANLGVNVKLKNKLSIRYKNGEQSSVESFVDEFFIDSFGNHSPIDKILFKGSFGNRRIGDSLPLDFLLTK
jgi:hypothetical protein